MPQENLSAQRPDFPRGEMPQENLGTNKNEISAISGQSETPLK